MRRYFFDIWDGCRAPDLIMSPLPSDEVACSPNAEFAITHSLEQQGPTNGKTWRVSVRNKGGALLRTIAFGKPD